MESKHISYVNNKECFTSLGKFTQTINKLKLASTDKNLEIWIWRGLVGKKGEKHKEVWTWTIEERDWW